MSETVNAAALHKMADDAPSLFCYYSKGHDLLLLQRELDFSLFLFLAQVLLICLTVSQNYQQLKAILSLNNGPNNNIILRHCLYTQVQTQDYCCSEF